jgi:hypothetical protein
MLNSIGLFGKSFAFGDSSIFGDGTAHGNISGTASYDAGTGTWTVTGAATVDIDVGTNAAVLMCKKLVVDGASAVLTVSTNCKGLLVFASVSVEVKNGGKIHIDKLGKAGNFGNLTPGDLVPAAWQGALDIAGLAAYEVQGEGVAGVAGAYTTSNGTITRGNDGAAATNGTMRSGSGGSGGVCYGSEPSNRSISGNSGKGGPCCGGAASGGASYSGVSTNAGDYGGPASAAAGSSNVYISGAAGDPVGATFNGNAALGAGGGLLMLFSPSISIASGCSVTAAGAGGGTGVGISYGMGGSGAGGGIVAVVTETSGLTNAGTISAPGGARGPSGGTDASANGGAGSVNLFELAA